jgi:hypothetical protein
VTDHVSDLRFSHRRMLFNTNVRFDSVKHLDYIEINCYYKKFNSRFYESVSKWQSCVSYMNFIWNNFLHFFLNFFFNCLQNYFSLKNCCSILKAENFNFKVANKME